MDGVEDGGELPPLPDFDDEDDDGEFAGGTPSGEARRTSACREPPRRREGESDKDDANVNVAGGTVELRLRARATSVSASLLPLPEVPTMRPLLAALLIGRRKKGEELAAGAPAPEEKESAGRNDEGGEAAKSHDATSTATAMVARVGMLSRLLPRAEVAGLHVRAEVAVRAVESDNGSDGATTLPSASPRSSSSLTTAGAEATLAIKILAMTANAPLATGGSADGEGSDAAGVAVELRGATAECGAADDGRRGGRGEGSRPTLSIPSALVVAAISLVSPPGENDSGGNGREGEWEEIAVRRRQRPREALSLRLGGATTCRDLPPPSNEVEDEGAKVPSARRKGVSGPGPIKEAMEVSLTAHLGRLEELISALGRALPALRTLSDVVSRKEKGRRTGWASSALQAPAPSLTLLEAAADVLLSVRVTVADGDNVEEKEVAPDLCHPAPHRSCAAVQAGSVLSLRWLRGGGAGGTSGGGEGGGEGISTAFSTPAPLIGGGGAGRLGRKNKNCTTAEAADSVLSRVDVRDIFLACDCNNGEEAGRGRGGDLIRLDEATLTMRMATTAAEGAPRKSATAARRLTAPRLMAAFGSLRADADSDTLRLLASAARMAAAASASGKRAGTKKMRRRRPESAAPRPLPEVDVSFQEVEVRLEAGAPEEGEGGDGGSSPSSSVVFRAGSRSLSLALVPSRAGSGEDGGETSRGRLSAGAERLGLSALFGPHRSLPMLDSADPKFGGGGASCRADRRVECGGILSGAELSALVPVPGAHAPSSASVGPPEMKASAEGLTLYEDADDYGRTEILRSSRLSASARASAEESGAVDGAIQSEDDSTRDGPPPGEGENARDGGPPLPRDNKTRALDVVVDLLGPSADLTWSPVLHWTALSCARRCRDASSTLRRAVAAAAAPVAPGGGAASSSSRRRVRARRATNVRLRAPPSSLIRVRAFAGCGSALDFRVRGLDVGVIHDKGGLNPKPNVSARLGRTSVRFGDRSGREAEEEASHVSVDGFEFRDSFRPATWEEISEYRGRGRSAGGGGGGGGASSSEDGDGLVRDASGHPLTEEIELTLGPASARFPPDLILGRIIEDVALTPRLFKEGLGPSGLLRGQEGRGEGGRRRRRDHQLMRIGARAPFVDVRLLDESDSGGGGGRGIGGEGGEILRLCLDSFSLDVRRLTPPSAVQRLLNDLDEDKSAVRAYGPVVQGGEVTIRAEHFAAILRPLTIVTPLCSLRGLKVNGALFLAGLRPDSPGLVPPRTIRAPLNCHHAACCSAGAACMSGYGAHLPSSGIPQKLYLDAAASIRRADLSHGAVVRASVPSLQCAIRRLTPPPPRYHPPVPPPPPLGWWDNLRFWIHGRIGVRAGELSVRYLLDSASNPDRSVLVTARDLRVEHGVGSAEIESERIIVSVPGSPYRSASEESEEENECDLASSCGIEKVGAGGRHGLLLVPRLELSLGFAWRTAHPGVRGGACHHSPYLAADHGGEGGEGDDRFLLFRSRGARIGASVVLKSDGTHANWIALRGDVLPWLTHRIIPSPAPAEPSGDDQGPGPMPPVDSVEVAARAEDLRVGLWFGDRGSSGGGSAESGESADGMCVQIKRIDYTSRDGTGKNFRAEGPIQACLLDIGRALDSRDGPAGATFLFDRSVTSLDATVGSWGEPDAGGGGDANNIKARSVLDLISSLRGEVPAYLRPEADGISNSLRIFDLLQERSRRIRDTDYLLALSHVDVLEKSLDKIRARSAAVSPNDDSMAAGGGGGGPRTILMGGLRLLWTLELRDALLPLIQDLILTVKFMQKMSHSDDDDERDSCDGRGTAGAENEDEDEDPPPDPEAGARTTRERGRRGGQERGSALMYLLAESFSDGDGSSRIFDASDQRPGTAAGRTGPGHNLDHRPFEYVPTIDVHLGNPQIQLHSESTGGSVILAMRGAYVEGRSYTHLYGPDADPSSIGDLLRKTEFIYTLEKMEMYAVPSGVDVAAGLQWLETLKEGENGEGARREDHKVAGGGPPGDPSEEARRDRASERRFPPHLSRHEPRPYRPTPAH